MEFQNLQVKNLKCNYRMNPLGISEAQPRLYWQIASTNRATIQKAYQIQVIPNGGDFENPLWDTGKMISDQSVHVKYEGPELQPRTRYLYRVRVWDGEGHESPWSDTAWWETGMMDETEWKAEWITPDSQYVDPQSEAAFVLHKDVSVSKTFHKAVIYVSSLGLYELSLNGVRVGDELLTPGWTSYHTRIQYQSYDITAQLKQGENSLNVTLADGWYKGGMGDERNRYKYGDRRAAFVQLHLLYEDGTEEVVVSDSTWKATLGPIQSSNLYNGETYDARLEIGSLEMDGIDWLPVEAIEAPKAKLVAQENNPVRVTETLTPVCSFVAPNGAMMLDMGQNMVGRMRIKLNVAEGTEITLKHAEVLDKEGNPYYGNLRTAKQTVTYVAKGKPDETYAPHFTFQGFRYVQVEGYPKQGLTEEGLLPLECFTGEIMHTDMERTGSFESSNPLINQLQQNIVWGQRGNFVDVPTDCPQRDERLGWTADAQVFMRTGLFNYQGAAFFTKWLRDLKADQLPDGGVPFVIPDTGDGASSAGWGDAAVICPWIFYQVYGDELLLAEQYDSMKRWVEYIRAQGPEEYTWTTGFHFGDWLALDAKENSFVGATPKELVSAAYYAYSTRLLRDTANVLGYTDDYKKYADLYEHVVNHFRGEYVTPFGRLAAPTQTAHVLALAFDLVEEAHKARIAKDLNELIIENDGHLSTGFIGTPLLCFALSDNGYHDTALKLVSNEEYPGWLYPVTKGATTIWEHWDGIKQDGSFWSDHMNSFNHYAYGSIGDWLYRRVAGLELDEQEPGYKRIVIAPRIGGRRLTYASATHESLYGLIECSWKVASYDEITVNVKIPANTVATIRLPGCKLEGLLENGQPAASVAGLTTFQENEQELEFMAGSGEYSFVYRAPGLFELHFTKESKVRDFLDDPGTSEMITRQLPEIEQPPLIYFAKNWTLQQLADDPGIPINQDRIESLLQEVKGDN